MTTAPVKTLLLSFQERCSRKKTLAWVTEVRTWHNGRPVGEGLGVEEPKEAGRGLFEDRPGCWSHILQPYFPFSRPSSTSFLETRRTWQKQFGLWKLNGCLRTQAPFRARNITGPQNVLSEGRAPHPFHRREAPDSPQASISLPP